MTGSRLHFALLLALVAISVAGCGGGDSGPAAPTNDVFITQADKICATGAEDLRDQITATFGNEAPTEEEGATFTTKTMVPLLTQQIEALRALTPPEGDEDTVGAIWDAMEKGLETVEADPEAGFGGTDPMDDALELARAYGFKSCGKVS